MNNNQEYVFEYNCNNVESGAFYNQVRITQIESRFTDAASVVEAFKRFMLAVGYTEKVTDRIVWLDEDEKIVRQ